MKLPDSVVKVTKGVRFDIDQNSVFDETGLAEDVCVLATVLNGRREGFEVVLLADATRPVTPEGGEKARHKMQETGTCFIQIG